MDEALKNLTVSDLVDQISTDRPIPGGGSASAVSAAVAAGLVGMVARLTLKRKSMKEAWEEMSAIADESDDLRHALLDLAQDDADAFAGVMEAWKLPRGEERDLAIERATITAAEVPLLVGRRALRVLQLAEKVVERGNPTAVTDGAVAAEMSHAALHGASYNVLINLSQLQGNPFAVEARAEVDRTAEAALELRHGVRAIVARKIS